MNQKDRRNLFLGAVVVTVLLVITLFVLSNRADATYTPIEETPQECVEVNAPDPIEFSKKIGIFNVTHQWQESPEGTWKLYKDLDPRGGHEYWVYTGDKIVENDCPEPEPEEEPEEPKVVFTGVSDGNAPQPKAPVCEDGDTKKVVANPHVIRNGAVATVNAFITEGDSVNIYWRDNNATEWQHAISSVKPNSDNFVSVEIGGLDPNIGYTFAIQQVESCGGGVKSVIIDPPANGELFRLSYYE